MIKATAHTHTAYHLSFVMGLFFSHLDPPETRQYCQFPSESPQMGLDALHVPAWRSVTSMSQQNTTLTRPEKGLSTPNTVIHLPNITFHRPNGVW